MYDMYAVYMCVIYAYETGQWCTGACYAHVYSTVCVHISQMLKYKAQIYRLMCYMAII